MSYEPTTWAKGDIVTASKLNKIEQGIANAGGGGDEFFRITVNPADGTTDKTYAETLAAYNAGKIPYLYMSADEESAAMVYRYATADPTGYFVFIYIYASAPNTLSFNQLQFSENGLAPLS